MRSGRPREGGFAYVVLLAAIAIAGGAAAHAVSLGAAWGRVSAEDELLAMGHDFEQALSSYRSSAPPGAPVHPRKLEDLLRDPRVPALKRHLRKIPIDPLTGGPWGIVTAADGSVLGIHSLSDERPIKRAGFAVHGVHFEKAESYRDWIFGERLMR